MTPQTRIETALDIALIRSRAGSCPPKLASALEYAVKPGGARIRPTICLNVARACGDDAPGLTDAACAAIELIHCGSLVHDDLPAFDNADVRRGKPTVHKAWSEPLAVLTGDTLIIMAFEQIALAARSDALRAATLTLELARYSGMPHGICAGQAWESEAQVDLSAYHRAKTGALFTAATRMGAAAAGADPEAWTELGARIGEAFQVADDLRDALYDEETLGKPAGQDVVNARPNAVSELGVQGAIKRLDDILSGAISSIPSCPGEAALCEMVRKTAERLTPVIPNLASVRTA
ncbi:geranylgeranyl pyrophosphate synthetase [Dinoroseobacter shibae DFL 12 = DSM 16493]|jgi:geranylgeranyl diphosphate synthase type II|uniref:Geranylgeranyl diphosphate synthase n=1 Tax=Dinoroseobacter shibae (strain DSM 16493 / NCIMB 14021 / DFL 12) TaxID=398580 RepID=A8LQ07_DINSH|nr:MULTISPECIES: polyprenyl synthetase family protein [Dinoroseobacter]ABV95247.1 geranylgeranyl pyrophosphate synthetase [Dinoroseobacter shibae DFL 12 = DSM 16493]MDD9718034.1 polyprenyl synthetase family protein [Dinoroseobacter sp. PD6]URF46656.1 polyprenyl synthetase family protein [Dinoroseobacter shibae]URF50962.1 polyprenyl synthetase family protein [Dinoroseobacter shibae]